MSNLNLYWAEEALGDPYAPQDYRWMKSSRRGGLMLGGAACVLTASTLLGGAAYLTMDRTPHVAISSYEIEVVAPDGHQPSPPAAPVPSPVVTPPAPAARAEAAADAHMARKEAAPTEIKVKAVPAPAPSPAEAKAQAARSVEPARPPAAAPAQAKATPTPATAAPIVPAAKPEPDTRVGISKGADSKPTDIASGEKLGIREILPDGIVMHNGRKVRNGSALPNGEILMGTDAGKGMAETDRRVLVLTP